MSLFRLDVLCSDDRRRHKKNTRQWACKMLHKFFEIEEVKGENNHEIFPFILENFAKLEMKICPLHAPISFLVAACNFFVNRKEHSSTPLALDSCCKFSGIMIFQVCVAHKRAKVWLSADGKSFLHFIYFINFKLPQKRGLIWKQKYWIHDIVYPSNPFSRMQVAELRRLRANGEVLQQMKG